MFRVLGKLAALADAVAKYIVNHKMWPAKTKSCLPTPLLPDYILRLRGSWTLGLVMPGYFQGDDDEDRAAVH